MTSNQGAPAFPSTPNEGREVASLPMDVDQGLSWSFDKTLCSVSHGNNCPQCKEFRKHVFEALFEKDPSLDKALKSAHRNAEQFADLQNEVDYLRERLDDRNGELRVVRRNCDDLAGTAEAMRDEIASLEARIYELGGTTPRDDARDRRKAAHGKARAKEPTDEMPPVEARVQTLSLQDRNVPNVGSSAGPSASGWSMGKADSFAEVVGRLPGPGMGSSVAVFQRRPVVQNPRSAIAGALRGGETLSLEQIKKLCERAHTGGPNGGPDVSAVSRVRSLVAAAHTTRQNGGALTPEQDWLLKNWRVPGGVEKSGDRVARQLGLAPRAAPATVQTAKGGLPTTSSAPMVVIDHAAQAAGRLSDAKARLNASPKAYFGLKAEGSTLPVPTRLLEIAVAISYLGPNKARLRRQFMALVATVLLSKGAYPSILRRAIEPLPARGQVPFEPPRGPIHVTNVINALWVNGVTVEEATSWDDFIVAWGRDYLRQPDIPADDDVRVAMQERDTAPKEFAILECFAPDGRPSRSPRVNTNALTFLDAPKIVPEGYDPEEGEYSSDDLAVMRPITSPMPPRPE
jgi:hypothetical protein